MKIQIDSIELENIDASSKDSGPETLLGPVGINYTIYGDSLQTSKTKLTGHVFLCPASKDLLERLIKSDINEAIKITIK